MSALKTRLAFLTSDLVLGSLVALLSVLAAYSGYLASAAGGDESKQHAVGLSELTNATAEYLTANQFIVYDFTMYDGWYTSNTPELEEYYQSSYSAELQQSVIDNPDDIFGESYYDAMYADANALFAAADEAFTLAGKYGDRGDALDLVLMFSAIALAFAAWASLLQQENPVRLAFAVLSILGFAYSLILFLQVPAVV
jgi:hypothetical protein